MPASWECPFPGMFPWLEHPSLWGMCMAEPVLVEVMVPDTIEEAYLEVREPSGGDVIA